MANVFTPDPNCVALWNFESGALTTDSIGTNTLTDNNTVGAETSDYKEGSACADLESANNEYFSIADADLDSGFPLKNGDSTKKISVCGWFKLESVSADRNIFTKHDPGVSKRSLQFTITSTNKFAFIIGYNSGASYEFLYEDTTAQSGRWYHFGFSFQDSDKSWKLVVWDDTASSKIIDASGTATNNINVEDADVAIGCYLSSGSPTGFFDGLIDEVVVFKDILTDDEIDDIRGGTYPTNIDVFATTANLTLTEQPASIQAPTNVSVSTESLVLSTNSATVELNQSISATTASLTLIEQAAYVEQGVVNVWGTTKAIALSEQSATVSLHVNAAATTQPLAFATYDATIWDGAAWATWLAANAEKVIRKYTFTLTGEDDGEEDIDIPFSSFQCRRRDGEPTYLSIVVKDLDYSSAIAARSNGDMKITMSYIVNGTIVYEDIISIVDLEDIQLDRGGSNQSISLTGHRTISYTPKSIELRDVTYYRLKDGKYIYRCAAPDLYLAPGDTATFGGTSFVVDQVQYTVSVLSQMMQVKEA